LGNHLRAYVAACQRTVVVDGNCRKRAFRSATAVHADAVLTHVDQGVRHGPEDDPDLARIRAGIPPGVIGFLVNRPEAIRQRFCKSATAFHFYSDGSARTSSKRRQK
jgi:hypothetical protein